MVSSPLPSALCRLQGRRSSLHPIGKPLYPATSSVGSESNHYLYTHLCSPDLTRDIAYIHDTFSELTNTDDFVLFINNTRPDLSRRVLRPHRTKEGDTHEVIIPGDVPVPLVSRSRGTRCLLINPFRERPSSSSRYRPSTIRFICDPMSACVVCRTNPSRKAILLCKRCVQHT